MLSLCLFWRPALKEKGDEIFLHAVSCHPPWLSVCLYAEFARARRLEAWMARAPAQVGYVILGLGGTFWHFGVMRGDGGFRVREVNAAIDKRRALL